ncbi:MAG: hypothetical protein KGJ23_08775 [Euryarchaeota archaeon]|nr:hypothetical protein [Euryarchaeota archaeon]MDE1836697.1 hypothetical protein [Euryarchaeota archaeon]MDE1880274.1 hypothetical protein [Euryarchaeota archaeon]MDE2044667.1 hypothetical protein [Thermoplasmata archaeon]
MLAPRPWPPAPPRFLCRACRLDLYFNPFLRLSYCPTHGFSDWDIVYGGKPVRDPRGVFSPDYCALDPDGTAHLRSEPGRGHVRGLEVHAQGVARCSHGPALVAVP